MIIDTKTIKDLLSSNITSYQIQKHTGIRTPMIDRYRKGESSFENMTLKVAKKLYTYALSLQKDSPAE